MVQYWGLIFLYIYSSDSAASPEQSKIETRDILIRVLFAEKTLQSEIHRLERIQDKVLEVQIIARPYSLS